MLRPSLLISLAGFVVADTAIAAPQGQTGPSARYGHTMAYDSARQCVVMFGGNSNGQWPGGALGDTWEWDGTSWVQRAPASSPSPRGHGAMAFDASRGTCIYFGGTTNGNAGLLNETWEWNGVDWSLRITSHAPSPRRTHSMVFDAAHQECMLFGGWDGSDKGDTWTFDGNNWLQEQTPMSPPARYEHSMAFQPSNGSVLLFGGLAGTTKLDDTWEWDGSNWLARHPANMPPRRHFHSMGLMPSLNDIVLFGGVNGTTVFGDTWLWDGSNWVPASSPISPSSRSASSIAYDAPLTRCVLFGGWDGSSSLNDTWTYDGTTWSGVPAAATSTFGVGCPGSNGTPVLAPLNLPTLGANFLVQASNLPTTGTTLNIGFFGFSRTSWGFIPLPYDLSPQGMPGCSMLVSPPPPGVILGSSSATGQCVWSQPVPLAPFLVGTELYFQALIPDALAGNPLGAIVTNGLMARIGW